MTHTAKFVAQNGKVVEQALLRKQADNADLAFLRPDHSLHSYYTDLLRAEQGNVLCSTRERRIERKESKLLTEDLI